MVEAACVKTIWIKTLDYRYRCINTTVYYETCTALLQSSVIDPLCGVPPKDDDACPPLIIYLPAGSAFSKGADAIVQLASHAAASA